MKERFLSVLLAIILILSSCISNFTVPVSAETENEILTNKNYVIVSKSTGKAITVEGYARGDNARIIQMPLNNYESQVWTLVDAGDGYYQIVNKFSGKAIDVPWGSTEEGTQMAQFSKGSGDNQKFKVSAVEDGYFRITPKKVENFALNIEGNSKSNGAAIIQWPYEGNDNEKWQFQAVENINSNPELETAEPKTTIDSYLSKFFYVEDGVGKLRNEPDNGFWTDAEILEVMIDAYEQLEDEKYKTVFGQFYDGIIQRRGTSWAWNSFNDDIMWMVIASARAYLLTGEQKYLDTAVSNFKVAYERAWSEDLGGGLWWTTDNNTKNACVNGPGTIAACLLGKATGDENYYDKAKKIFQWEKEKLFDTVENPGAVWDSLNAEGKYSTWASTYNQGTFIGAAAMLYLHTGDKEYYNAAKLAADYASTMGDGVEGYLNREQNTGDLIGFKGILGRWLGYFARECNVSDYNDWMDTNAKSAWTNRNSDNLMWTEFGRITVDNIENSNKTLDGKNTISNYAAWGCSAAVSWVLNSPKSSNVEENKWEVQSPDGATSMNVQLTNSGYLYYSANQDGESILEDSHLGIITNLGDFSKNLRFKSTSEKVIDETYPMLSGKRTEYRNYCKEKTITFTKNNVSDVEFDLVVRVYNDGIAFRYVIRTDSGRELTINPGDEITTFKVPEKTDMWYMPRTQEGFMYEDDYLTGKVEDLIGAQPSMPMLYKTGNKYALVTEADKHGTYVGSFLKVEAGRNLRTKFDLAQKTAVKTQAPFSSPWRTVIIGSSETLVNNTMVENLSPAQKEGYDFESWVEPGVSSWSWVSYYGGQTNPDIHKKFIDLASNMGWKYYILDEEWQPKSSTSGIRYEGMSDWFEEVKQYADDRGVKLIAWVDKTDVLNDVEREKRFKEWSEVGIAGIKVDFFYNESQEMLQLHDKIYEDAAKYHLLVNVHGSNPPSGEVRTYPNVIAREAIKGQEQGGITAEQYTLIPFIRAAVGTADVTEQLYSRDTTKTTMGFQIALSTLVENGIHSMGSKPEDYYGIPEAASYYKNFPARWEDVHLISADVGAYINLARKSGTSWYAAGISVSERDVVYQPTFLEKNKKYTAIFYEEKSKERQKLSMRIQKDVTSDTELRMHVQKGGGYAVKLIPQEGESLTAIGTVPRSIKLQSHLTKEINVVYVPSNTKLTDVVWSVENEEIAKVTPTVKGGVIRGLKEGKTIVTVTSRFDESKSAQLQVEVTPENYTVDTNNWQVINDDTEYLVTGENSVEIKAQQGVIDKDVFAMKVPEGTKDFTITAKISGGFNENFQGGFIGVFDLSNPNNLENNYVGVGRRYHTFFNTGGSNPNNHFAVMNGQGTEFYCEDSDCNRDAYVKLVKEGNVFKGYYRFDDASEWTLIYNGEKNSITDSNFANSDNLYIGFYAGTGGSTNETTVKFEDFTFNGSAVKIANYNLKADSVYQYNAYDIEAESGRMIFGAKVVDADECSNGAYVGDIGGSKHGTVTFTVNCDTTSVRKMKIYYATYEKRTFKAVVNGKAEEIICPSTGEWEKPCTEPIEVMVTLQQGKNVIQFTGVGNNYAPNLDKVVIQLTESELDIVNGLTQSITVNGFQISNVHWGIRAVSSVESEINGKKVVSYGNIYGIVRDGFSDEDMVLGSTSECVKAFEATDKSTIDLKFSESDTATNYVMTMVNNGNTAEAYDQNYKIRAYAKLSDGSVVYSDIYDYSIFRIASIVYDNNLVNSEEAYNYLYHNILQVVDANYKEGKFDWRKTIVSP